MWREEPSRMGSYDLFGFPGYVEKVGRGGGGEAEEVLEKQSLEI